MAAPIRMAWAAPPVSRAVSTNLPLFAFCSFAKKRLDPSLTSLSVPDLCSLPAFSVNLTMTSPLAAR